LCTGCIARDRKRVQSGKRSLFSKTRPSRVDPFHYVVPMNFLRNKLYLLSPFRSKQATLNIDTHGRVGCFVAAKPARRAKARYVFALGPVVHSIHIQTCTVKPVQIKPPHPRQPYLQGTRPFGRSYYKLQCTLILRKARQLLKSLIDVRNTFSHVRNTFLPNLL
jgi:hypothetical protein